MKKEVFIVLLDRFADWETAFLAPVLRSGIQLGPDTTPGRYEVKYMTPGGRPVRSMGGLCVEADCDLSALPETAAGLVLAGGTGWQTPEAEQVAGRVGEALARNIPVGAICNATLFLAAHGFLNAVQHTGNTAEMMELWGGSRYTGRPLYRERQAVSDGGIVTANGSASLEFARELLRLLDADTPERIEAWYVFNRNGFYKR